MKKEKEKKKKKIKVQGNRRFIVIRDFLVISFVFSVLVSIADKHWEIFPWPNNYENIIGVSSQIITAILSLVVSIIGIAISLQNEDFFGVKITKLYALRVAKHYSILEIILVSIILSCINLATYMLGLTFASIAVLVISLIFLIQVVCMEIPIMAKEEKALLQILKDNFIYCYLHRKEASLDLKESVKYLLYIKNFNELYKYFKDEFDDEYNQYVVMKLIELQRDMSLGLPDKSAEEQRVIGSSLLTNVVDIMLRHTDICDNAYDEIATNPFLLTSILYKINSISGETNPLLKRIPGLVQCISFSSKDTKKMDSLISSVIVVLTAETVKKGDFRIIKAIRKELSHMGWGLEKDSPILTVFSVISLHLYYLCCSEPEVPSELRTQITEFINEVNVIEDQTRISSWKQLFIKAAKWFNVNYSDFLKLVMKHEDNLEYWLYGTGAKVVVLTPSYVSKWYLTNFINKDRFSEIEFDSLISSSIEVCPMIKQFGDACLDDDKNFTSTDEMKEIINFYDESRKHFLYFRLNEKRNNTLFKLVNQLKAEELKRESNLVEQIDPQQFTEDIVQRVELALKKEWGFNSTLSINNQERCFAVLFEKFPDEINFKEMIVDSIVRSVFADIEKTVKKTVVDKEEDFEKCIHSWLAKNVKFITTSAIHSIPYFYVVNDSIRSQFEEQCKSWTEIESELLGIIALVTEKGFSFNCEIKEVKFRKLSDEELSRQVEKYQREDGQYVFKGTFLPKEEIAEIIKDRFTILNVVFCHQVISGEDDILELNPYL